MKIGFIGLGNMGLNMVKNLLDDQHEIVAWNRSEEPRDEAAKAGAKVVESISDLKDSLDKPRVIFSMISAGPVVDKILFDNGKDSITEVLEDGDIFIDGVNSHYKDSVRRAAELKKHGITMLDVGVSGGVDGARNGACMMIGGDKKAFEFCEPIFKDATQTGGYGYFGESGAGHFVKMVHNAIEYGMMQVIGEGLNLINVSEYEPDMDKMLDVWGHGSIIEGKLIEFLKKGIDNNGPIEKQDEVIGSLGTGQWAAKDAMERAVPFTSIAHAVYNRYASRGNDNYAFKVIQTMRAEFGAHNSQERPSQ